MDENPSREDRGGPRPEWAALSFHAGRHDTVLRAAQGRPLSRGETRRISASSGDDIFATSIASSGSWPDIGRHPPRDNGGARLAGELVERRLMAVLAADVVGNGRLFVSDEEAPPALWKAQWRELIDPRIVEYGGRVGRITGHPPLVEFK